LRRKAAIRRRRSPSFREKLGNSRSASAPRNTDFCHGLLALDSEKEEAIVFLKQLMKEFPDCHTKPISVSQIVDKVFPPKIFPPQTMFEKSTLRDFVPDGLIGPSGSSFAKRLGKWLKRVSTRRWGNIELIAVEDTHEGVWKYRIGENIKKKAAMTAVFEEIGTVAA
jgi:hypothetical protein